MVNLLQGIDLGQVSHPKYGDGVFASAELVADYYPTLDETIENAHVWIIDQDGGDVGDREIGDLDSAMYEAAVELITEAWYKRAASGIETGRKDRA